MTTLSIKDGGGSTVTVQAPPSPGQAAMAASVPVAIASDQTSIPVTAAAGSAIIGNVGIDQTTPGTTNGVVVNALPTSGGTVAASIASGAALSGVIDLGTSQRLCRIILPATWTAAALTFQTSVDGTNFYDLFDVSGNEISYTVTAGKNILIPFSDWIGIRYLKLRSGVTATPVNQGATASFTLVTA